MNNERDRWGLSTREWKKIRVSINSIEKTGSAGFVPRVILAVEAMRQELTDAGQVLDTAGIIRGQAGSPDLSLGTRVDLLVHQLNKARAERDTARISNQKLLERFGEWLGREAVTLFDTTSEPLDPVDYPEVDFDAQLIRRFFAEYAMSDPAPEAHQ